MSVAHLTTHKSPTPSPLPLNHNGTMSQSQPLLRFQDLYLTPLPMFCYTYIHYINLIYVNIYQCTIYNTHTMKLLLVSPFDNFLTCNHFRSVSTLLEVMLPSDQGMS